MKKHSLLLFVQFLLFFSVLNAYNPRNYLLSNHSKKLGVFGQFHFQNGSVSQLGKLQNLNNQFYTGASFGVQGALQLKKNLFGEVGFAHMQSGVQYSYDKGPSNDLLFQADQETIKEHFDFLSIPINFVLYNSPNRLRNFVRGGLMLNLLYRQTQTQTLSYEGKKVTSGVIENSSSRFNVMNPGFYFGIGWEYDLEQNFGIRIEPFVSINLVTGDTKMQLINVGLSVSAHFLEN
jgi:hypothetical protein